jgi:hypothetical protein
VPYVRSGSVRMEALIEQLRERQPVTDGLVAIMSAMESDVDGPGAPADYMKALPKALKRAEDVR